MFLLDPVDAEKRAQFGKKNLRYGFDQHISDMTAVTVLKLKLNYQGQFPYNLTKR